MTATAKLVLGRRVRVRPAGWVVFCARHLTPLVAKNTQSAVSLPAALEGWEGGGTRARARARVSLFEQRTVESKGSGGRRRASVKSWNKSGGVSRFDKSGIKSITARARARACVRVWSEQ